MKRDDGPVPQFTNANRRGRLKRNGSGGSKWDCLDALCAIDGGDFVGVLVKLVASLFEHHH